MATTHERSAPLAGADVGDRYTIDVGGTPVTVRAATIWPIPEVLDHAEAIDGLLPDPAAAADLVADLHDSRMIVPPRPRRRRQRPLSSRALFYAGGVE